MIELTDGHEREVWDAAFRAFLTDGQATVEASAERADEAVRVWRTRMRPTPTASPVPTAQALGRVPQRFADGGPTDDDMRGEVVHGD